MSHRVFLERQRALALTAFQAQLRQIEHSSLSASEKLDAIAEQLQALALRSELFSAQEYPVQENGRLSTTYKLAEEAGGRYSLLLIHAQQGNRSPSHDHTTWAIIAGVEGVERNTIYRRLADEQGLGRLEPLRTADVGPGDVLVLGVDDVHRIEQLSETGGLHLHLYGLGLEQLHGRVAFEQESGGAYRHFAPFPASYAQIAPAQLHGLLQGEQELAVLDVREVGVFLHAHLLHSHSLPLWRIDVQLASLVPNPLTPIVLVDADGQELVHEAAQALLRHGYTNVKILSGGVAAWEQQGFEVYEGTNVPSKAFGEWVEHHRGTPSLTADQLDQLLQSSEQIVLVDSRTPEEFYNFSIDQAHNLPGGELLYRIGDLLPDEKTPIVVNCAGRTRSIIGAQTLIDAGLPNPVYSLQNGTIAWLFAGQTLQHGRSGQVAAPTSEALEQARKRAKQLIKRYDLAYLDHDTVATWRAQARESTTYWFDTRTQQEYEAGHLPGFRWAPGGQLVQATDTYIGVRNSAIVLADWDGVRAVSTAAWLKQLGWRVYLYRPEPGADLWQGAESIRILRATEHEAPWLRVEDLQQHLSTSLVVDIDSSIAYAKAHIAGAWFVVPDHLPELLNELRQDATQAIVLTSKNGVLAQRVASRLLDLGYTQVSALLGGTQAWLQAGLARGQGHDRNKTGQTDEWYSGYVQPNPDDRFRVMQEYIDWELGLVAQIERDPTAGFVLP